MSLTKQIEITIKNIAQSENTKNKRDKILSTKEK